MTNKIGRHELTAFQRRVTLYISWVVLLLIPAIPILMVTETYSRTSEYEERKRFLREPKPSVADLNSIPKKARRLPNAAKEMIFSSDAPSGYLVIGDLG